MTDTIAVALAVAMLVVSGWGFVAPYIALQQRLALIDARSIRPPLYWDMVQEFENVSHWQHCLRVLTFRSPRRLYGPITHEVMGWTLPTKEKVPA